MRPNCLSVRVKVLGMSNFMSGIAQSINTRIDYAAINLLLGLISADRVYTAVLMMFHRNSPSPNLRLLRQILMRVDLNITDSLRKSDKLWFEHIGLLKGYLILLNCI